MVSLSSYQTDEFAQAVSLAVYEACARKVAAESRRGYLGMSQIGKSCERALWLDLNLGEKKPVEGQLARIFENGKTREEAIIADLEAAGYQVVGQQTAFEDFGGLFRGHCDGVIVGVTKSHDHLLEIKTANDASFKSFVKHGAKRKPEYWAQMQCYMGYAGLERSLFVVENKNNQELYTERVYFDPKAFEENKAKARRIIEAQTAPEKPVDESGCYWCPFKNFSCDDPPAVKNRPPKKEGCQTCLFYWPAAEAPQRSQEIVGCLRLCLNTLKHSTQFKLGQNIRECEKHLIDALKLRPDLSLPMSIFHADLRDPVERFCRILEYILTPGTGYCTAGFIDGNDAMRTAFTGEAAANDWCLHPDHKTKIYRTVGCDDCLTDKAPF